MYVKQMTVHKSAYMEVIHWGHAFTVSSYLQSSLCCCKKKKAGSS